MQPLSPPVATSPAAWPRMLKRTASDAPAPSGLAAVRRPGCLRPASREYVAPQVRLSTPNERVLAKQDSNSSTASSGSGSGGGGSASSSQAAAPRLPLERRLSRNLSRSLSSCSSVERSPSPKRRNIDVGSAGPDEGLSPTKTKPPAPSWELSAKADMLLRLVLRKASGGQEERVVCMLRERVSAGRKVHGQTITLEEVEEAVAAFRGEPCPHEKANEQAAAPKTPSPPTPQPALQEQAPPQAPPPPPPQAPPAAARKRGSMTPFGGPFMTVAFQGSYMPPSAVSQLVGDEVCAICLEALRKQAQTIALCGHIFHRSCLNNAGSLKCPKCRLPVDMDRERLHELKRLIMGTTRQKDICAPHFWTCNVLEMSRADLLQSCNARRCNGEFAYTTQEIDQALSELEEEEKDKILVEEKCVTLMM